MLTVNMRESRYVYLLIGMHSHLLNENNMNICFPFAVRYLCTYLPFFVFICIFHNLFSFRQIFICVGGAEMQLNLSHRNLRELDANALIATYGECIEYLDVSHNRITRLDWISQLPDLRCLIMDDNRLRESHFEKLKKVPLPKITTLTLNKNEVSPVQ